MLEVQVVVNVNPTTQHQVCASMRYTIIHIFSVAPYTCHGRGAPLFFLILPLNLRA